MPDDSSTVMMRSEANGAACRLVSLAQCSAPEHAHADVQITVPFFRSVFTARWHTTAGRSRQRTVRAAECCVIPSGQPHRFHWQEPAEMINLYLETSWLKRTADEAPGRGGCWVPADYSCQDPVLLQLGQALREAYTQAATPSRLLIEGAAAVAVSRLLRRKITGKPVAPRSCKMPAGSLRRALAFIQDHLDASIGLLDLAAAAGYSPFHFARAFKEATGLPPHRYVLRERIESARRRLGESLRPVGQVGLECGFANENHFVRVFRRATGLTPHRYRLAMASSKRRARTA